MTIYQLRIGIVLKVLSFFSLKLDRLTRIAPGIIYPNKQDCNTSVDSESVVKQKKICIAKQMKLLLWNLEMFFFLSFF